MIDKRTVVVVLFETSVSVSFQCVDNCTIVDDHNKQGLLEMEID